MIERRLDNEVGFFMSKLEESRRDWNDALKKKDAQITDLQGDLDNFKQKVNSTIKQELDDLRQSLPCKVRLEVESLKQ